MIRPANEFPDEAARLDALERAMRIADRLAQSDSPLLEQFGEQMRNTLFQAGPSTTTVEIEEIIATVMRLGDGYGVELEDL